jgi:hypothetical protein
MRSLFRILPIVITFGLLGSCDKLCEDDPSAISSISNDGTRIYALSNHCSALNNHVGFYFQSPKTGTTLLAEGDSLEYSGLYFDKKRRTIFIIAPFPGEMAVRQRIEDYSVRAIDVQTHTPKEQALFDRWSRDPNDPEASDWFEEQVRRRDS